ncbi:MAG: hypothetical protein ABH856_00420 [Patescibacteria group bacterium]
MGKKRLLCLACNNLLVPWGKTSSGRKRFYCRTCGTSRIFKKKETDFFSLFRQYVLWGHTYTQLSDISSYSIQYLSRKFHEYLFQSPPNLPLLDQSNTEEAFLLLDGLWLKRGFVLMAYRQSKNLKLLHISVVGREAATKIVKDLHFILSLGYRFTGIVSDGGTGMAMSFLTYPHQICLAHLHRDVIAAIGMYPKSERIRELKRLADHVWLIESKEALRRP